MKRGALQLALVLACLVPSGCSIFGGGAVVRRVHGRTSEGPFVSPEAYGAFARGAVHEAHGELSAARDAYSAANRAAPTTAEPLIRLGAVMCRLGQDPASVFSRAEDRDPELASLWTARSSCFLRAGNLPRAVAEAERAVALAPADLTTSLALLEAVQALGDAAREARLRAALAARWQGDPRLDIVKTSAPAPLAQVDAALRRGDGVEAERLGRLGGLSLAALALRAAALGRVDHARRLSSLVFSADPSSADARIALLVATDLAGDEAAFREALRPSAAVAGSASPLGVALLDELLRRRTGAGVPREEGAPGGEPVLDALRGRAGR